MTTSPEQDAQLDNLNNQGFSYAQAYELLGLEAPSATSVSADAMEASRARQASRDYYSEEFRLTGNEPLSPKQIATNQLGAAACREVINKHKPQQ